LLLIWLLCSYRAGSASTGFLREPEHNRNPKDTVVPPLTVCHHQGQTDKKISGDKCSQKELNDFIAEHKPHDLSTNTFINSTDPRVLKMAEEAMKNQQKSRQG
jgi:hypothetical protein